MWNDFWNATTMRASKLFWFVLSISIETDWELSMLHPPIRNDEFLFPIAYYDYTGMHRHHDDYIVELIMVVCVCTTESETNRQCQIIKLKWIISITEWMNRFVCSTQTHIHTHIDVCMCYSLICRPSHLNLCIYYILQIFGECMEIAVEFDGRNVEDVY